jgi:hypothetical protein
MPTKHDVLAIILVACSICYGAGNDMNSTSKEISSEMEKRKLPKQTITLSKTQCDTIFITMKNFCPPSQTKLILLLLIDGDKIFFIGKNTNQCILLDTPNDSDKRKAKSCNASLAVDHDKNQIELSDEAFNQLVSLIYNNSNHHTTQEQSKTETVEPSFSAEPETVISKKASDQGQNLTACESIVKSAIDLVNNLLTIWSNWWIKRQNMQYNLMQKMGKKLIDGVSNGTNKVFDKYVGSQVSNSSNSSPAKKKKVGKKLTDGVGNGTLGKNFRHSSPAKKKRANLIK